MKRTCVKCGVTYAEANAFRRPYSGRVCRWCTYAKKGAKPKVEKKLCERCGKPRPGIHTCTATPYITKLEAEVERLKKIEAAAIRCVNNPAFAAVCDEDVQLVETLRGEGE